LFWPNWGIITASAWKAWGKPSETWVMIAGIPAGIQTKHILNVSLQCRY
jgi:hypothetical protein